MLKKQELKMKIIKLITLIIFFSSLQFCKQEKEIKKEVSKKNDNYSPVNKNTSLIKLISNPENFHGKRIRVTGYLNLEFEGDAIYLNNIDYEYGIYENAVWVNFADKIDMDNQLNPSQNLKYFNHKFVIIEGTFNKNAKGHMSLFAGEIENIDVISLTVVEFENEFKKKHNR